MANGLPSIPSKFNAVALAFPDKARAEVAQIKDIKGAQAGIASSNVLIDWAKRIDANREAINALQHGRLIWIAGLAKLMPRKPGQRTDLTSTGDQQRLLSHDTLRLYRKVGDSADKIDTYIAQVNKQAGDATVSGMVTFATTGGIANRHLAGDSAFEWYTPAEYIEKARKTMGGIDLDPASCELAQKVINAKRFYTEKDDGLQHNWSGRVFLNPPYKMPLVGQFTEKLCEEIESGTVTQAILLTNNATDTAWWHKCVDIADAVCFTRGRISFYSTTGNSKSPTHGQSFLYFGHRIDQFLAQFNEVGKCLGGFE